MAQKQQKTCTYAILAMIFAFLCSPLGFLFGIIALYKIKNNPKLYGKELAIFAIIFSIIIIIVSVIILLLSIKAWLSIKCC